MLRLLRSHWPLVAYYCSGVWSLETGRGLLSAAPLHFRCFQRAHCSRSSARAILQSPSGSACGSFSLGKNLLKLQLAFVVTTPSTPRSTVLRHRHTFWRAGWVTGCISVLSLPSLGISFLQVDEPAGYVAAAAAAADANLRLLHCSLSPHNLRLSATVLRSQPSCLPSSPPGSMLIVML